jgi:hypothetical protein
LRIVPPLAPALVVSVTVFIVGPLVTTWPAQEHPQTWRDLVGTTLVMLLQHRLPGVFDNNLSGPCRWRFSATGWCWPSAC